ncbi:Domain of unknown function DUF1816 [Rippkaea orientalis PCC 8801]|uniref:CpcD-like domain-containing protein n=1 Tax=Rippkaea orientalis (strain PCC 8801 / RF-1) TaxID=41431 RepID=B7JVT3_RIPO1|nr:DUF1816 domain-containing protein [Rippkaea orientalis]ACK64654.1 Domain of unknown function DUF1816 [Rippkaea orientalis PCC 8801]
MATNNDANSRFFLYEVAIQPQSGGFNKIKGLIYQEGKIFLKVPYGRMKQEMKRIQRLGGKIVNITPITEISSLKESLDLIEPEIEEISVVSLGLPWWVEISTTHPNCLYYFGPFDSAEEALSYQDGYVEDLREEGAQNITLYIKQCQPQVLTQEWD